jgi:molybdenum transport protein
MNGDTIYFRIPDAEIERFIGEDLPYGDLTTSLLGIGEKRGEIRFTSRERSIVCCTEEAARVLEHCGATLSYSIPSGRIVEPGTLLLTAEGPAASLHAGWKVALNLLEYASGIATRTRTIVDRARAVNPRISVVTTRKSFPGTRQISTKAVMAGGALPHRLGLSESILVFRQHTAFLGGLDHFLQSVSSLKQRAPEHRIIVEADSAEEALRIAASGIDLVQIDKMAPDELTTLVTAIRKSSPGVSVSAAGGINADNAAEYAATGIDIIVLSSVYFGKPSDISAVFNPEPSTIQP